MLTPLQFFTKEEISFLQNRLVCGKLDELPGPNGWWDRNNEDQDQVLGTLPDQDLASEAYELMFGEESPFFWRISWLASDYQLVMTEKRILDKNGGDPRAVVFSLNTIKQEDLDEESEESECDAEMGGVEESHDYEAMDNVMETSGQDEPEEFDNLDGFVVCDD
jgi:hypothetical protein